jgi:Zn-dependent M16 (insulinase) family peptidase
MQKYETENIYHGFKLKRSEFKQEMNSHLMMFEHEKTGAHLVAVKNDDDNKTFCIAFKTIPEDCTGVAHILEHSVLSGSEKYPVKDVFSELYKGGLSTFMNAFTTPDSTYYPFSTRNDKEYYNFMSVYLDTTLRPLLKKHTFLQEGWHYDIKDEKSPIEYQGIVYNEMKGAMSNPLSQMSQYISKTLLPNSTYSHNSGGDPEKITNLSYEYFLDFHKKYYHPSNSLTYIYGNADLEKELAFINDNYFKDYDRSDATPEISCSVTIPPMHTAKYHYPASKDDPDSHKTYISISTKICSPKDVELNAAMHIIADILFNSDASPVKKAVITSGIAEDFSGYYDDSQNETVITAYVSGSDVRHEQKFREIYYNALKEVAEKGIDRELILSEIDHLEFKQREKEISSMRGLIYMYRVMNLGLYDVDIFENINFSKMLTLMREKTGESGYFENLIKKYLFDEKVTAVVVMEPHAELAEQKQKSEKEKLEAYKNSLSEEEVKNLLNDYEEFKRLQTALDSEEDVLKIPKLDLRDIGKRSESAVTSVENTHGFKCYCTEMFTNGIVYLSLGFDLSKIPFRLLTYIGILSDLFKDIGTSNRCYEKLTNEISSVFGNLDFSLTMEEKVADKDYFRPVLYIEARFLKKNLEKAFEILKDIIENIDLENAERVKEVIKSRFLYREMYIKSEGYDYSVTRIKACVNDRGRFLEQVKGLSFYEKNREIYTDSHKNMDTHISALNELMNLIFNIHNFHSGIISDSEGLKAAKEKCREFTGVLDQSDIENPIISYPEYVTNEAFTTPSDIVFASMGGDLFKNGLKYSGKLEVIKNYLSSDYLFDAVRLKGGAYGVWMSLNARSGFLSFTSYRDPNVKKTYDAYYAIPSHLKKFRMNETAFTNIKIGAYAGYDPHLSPYAKGKKSRDDLISGITSEYIDEKINEILETKQEDFRDAAEIFEEYLKHAVISTIGNRDKIIKDKDIFTKITGIK